ncbi:M16 family metallopeptidase [Pseudogulbenkiania subflava]|uniref:Zinc protease n=1 Tax=Pseudogulbenkiania subflava DSM 22618 TaxID=1123014 RepID=A0A1Y6CGG1_9NEIS|nr:pitrilysin family protein [Pseudogulbenkiania subflava]SMF51891.1 zinc protease [Pseudogulbenkiania subflava DSM 22618]
MSVKLSKSVIGWLAVSMLLGGMAQAVTIQHWNSAQGARVYFVEAHANPIVDLRVEFDAGNRREDPAKPGVSDMTASLLDAGTARRSEEQLREALADTASSLSAFAELEGAGVTLRTLARPAVREQAVALAADVLAHPAFPAAILEREKARTIENLRQEENDAGFLAQRELTRQMYPQHPYGINARVSAASLKSITRADLLAFWRSHYQPRYAVVSIVGDLSRAEAERLAEELLAGLANRPGSLPAIPPVALPPAGKTVKLTHPGTQTHMALGMPVITRDDPDYFPLLVGNYALGGGGFDARLMKEVRDKRGLTYGVSSNFSPYQRAGEFGIGLSTRNDQAATALKVTRDTLRQFIEEGPSAAELEQAKANIIGGFPLRFDSNGKLLGYLGVIGLYQLPLTFLDDYVKHVAAVTPDQVRDAWRRRIHPEQMATVIVGPNS